MSARLAWTCDLHGVTTTDDCPACDDELIAMTEEASAMTDVKCHKCGHVFAEGESAWAEEWRTIDVSGTTAAFRTETRYLCDDCEAMP